MDAQPSAFELALAALDSDALRGLVADLWRARGREVDPTGDGPLRVTLPDGSERLVALDGGPDPPPAPPAGADAVVTTRRVEDVPPTVVDAADLRRLLLYAVDRGTTRDLCERYLDGTTPEPDTGPATVPPATRDRGSPTDDPDPGASETGSSRIGSGGTDPVGDDAGGVTAVAATGDPGATADDDSRTGLPAALESVGAARLALVAVAVVLLAAAAAGLGPATGVAGLGGVDGDERDTPGESDGGTDPETAAGGTDASADEVTPYGAGRSSDADAGAGSGGGPDGPTGASEAAVARLAGSGPLPPATTVDGAGGSAVVAGGIAAARLPPGVAPDGTVDESVLGAAHAAVLANDSYRATLTHGETLRGRPVGLRRETIAVENATRFAVTVEQYGRLAAGSQVVAEDPSFATGGRRVVLVRPNETYDYRLRASSGSGGPIADRLATYVRWFLSVEDSRIADTTVRDGRRLYWLVFANDTYPGIVNTTGTALIDERGFVHRMTRSYEYPGRNGVVVTATVAVSDVGRTTAEPPAWYRQAANGSVAGRQAANGSVAGDDRRRSVDTAELGLARATSRPSASTPVAGREPDRSVASPGGRPSLRAAG